VSKNRSESPISIKETIARKAHFLSVEYGVNERELSRIMERDCKTMCGLEVDSLRAALNSIDICFGIGVQYATVDEITDILKRDNFIFLAGLLSRMVQFSAFQTYLFTLDELHRLVTGFLDAFNNNKDEIIRSGHPSVVYGHSWQLNLLLRSYFTRVPNTVVHSNPRVHGTIEEVCYRPSGCFLPAMADLHLWKTHDSLTYDWSRDGHDTSPAVPYLLLHIPSHSAT